MTIEFHCSSCQHRMRTPDSTAGKKGKCPRCGAVMDIPARSPDAQRAAGAIPPTTLVAPTGRPAGDPPTDGKIDFPCPYCGRPVRTPAAAGGKKGKCPSCAAIVQIPEAAPTPKPARQPAASTAGTPTPRPAVQGAAAIEFSCPKCPEQFRTPASGAGKKGQCPRCKTLFVIPAESPPRTAAGPQTIPGQPGRERFRASSAPQPQSTPGLTPLQFPSVDERDLLTADWNSIVPERRLPSAPRKPQPALRHLVAKHTSWLIPVAACVLFVILIAGILGVRKIIIRKAGETVALVKRVLGTAGPEAATSLEDQVGDKEPSSEEQASLEPDEPGLEVLPAAAAKLPGRKLPRLLFVGRHPQMFQSLAEAVKVAIPGDIIEIRTNGPLVEEGAELRVKQKVNGAPLVIRAGRGFQPVVRAGLVLGNADLRIVGIHFAPVALSAEDGNVLLERCTMTKGGLGFRNSQPKGMPLEVVFDRCLLRYDFGIDCVGSGITLTIRDSGLCHSNSGGAHVSFDSVEDNAIFVHQSTLVHVYFLGLQMGNEPPRNGFRFRMERSVFGVLWAAPSFVIVRLPDAYIRRGQPACRETLQRVFGEFTAADNLCNYYFPGALQVLSTAADGASYEMDWNVFPSWAPDDPTLKYGKRVEEARFLTWEKGNLAEADRTLSCVLPEDLVVQSTGPLATRIQAGVRYGCDVTQLPVPPPVTLELAGLVAAPLPTTSKAGK